MRLKSILIIFLFLTVVQSCKGNAKMKDSERCSEYYNKALSILNGYYENKNQNNLKEALSYVENGYKSCSDLKPAFIELKIRLLILMKAYKEGDEFISSLDVKDFHLSYKKNLYQKTFKGLYLVSNGDSVNSTICFKELSDEITKYIAETGFNRDAITDLVYVESRFKNEKEIIEKIELMETQNKSETDFFEALKETVKYYLSEEDL